MALLLGSFLADFLLLLTAAAVCIVVHYKRAYRYWKDKGVPYLEPSIPRGNVDTLLVKGFTLGVSAGDFYTEFKKRNCPFGGVYVGSQPILVVTDPELIKNIWTKDFQYFTDRGLHVNEKVDPLSAHLFTVGGLKWRNLRVKFTPTFTSGKMKMMFNTLVECGECMQSALRDQAEKSQEVDIKNVCSGYTVDVIGNCVFGIQCNSFKDPNAEFLVFARELFMPNLYYNLKKFIHVMAPTFSRLIGLKTFRYDLEEFFFRAVKDVINFRERNNQRRLDFMQLLIDMKNNVSIDESSNKPVSLTLNELVAQAILFFIAGFETSSTTMQYCLYELSKNLEIQRKVREEIRDVYEKHDRKLTYDMLNEMKYLAQVVDETLRMYPPVPNLTRECVRKYKIPGTEVEIEPAVGVFVPIYALQRDPEYFEDPNTFNPERFSDENKDKIKPFTYLPFGDGPRNCIGLRFGRMQVKTGLFYLLKDFEYTPNRKTTDLQLDRTAFLLQLKNNIYLNMKKVES